LILRNCLGLRDFLRGVIELGQIINLILLEVQTGISDDFDIPKIILTFLGVFEGLENLYVTYVGLIDTIVFWRLMLYHRSAFTRFAYYYYSSSSD